MCVWVWNLFLLFSSSNMFPINSVMKVEDVNSSKITLLHCSQKSISVYGSVQTESQNKRSACSFMYLSCISSNHMPHLPHVHSWLLKQPIIHCHIPRTLLYQTVSHPIFSTHRQTHLSGSDLPFVFHDRLSKCL